MGADREVEHLVLYDGACKLCNASVNFILKHEQSDNLLFTPLQSGFGQSLLKKHGLPEDYTESLLFFTKGRLLSHAPAALNIARFLRIPWRWTAILRILPSTITNFFYKIVARHRYKLMGQSEACTVPHPQTKERFLE